MQWTSPVAQTVKNPPGNVGEPGSVPGLARSPGEGNGNPLQYSCLENPMDRRAWRTTVHGVAESDMTKRLSLHAYRKCSGENNPKLVKNKGFHNKEQSDQKRSWFTWQGLRPFTRPLSWAPPPFSKPPSSPSPPPLLIPPQPHVQTGHYQSPEKRDHGWSCSAEARLGHQTGLCAGTSWVPTSRWIQPGRGQPLTS